MTSRELEKELEDIIGLLKALSGRNCLKILQALSEPKYWSQLIEELDMHRWVLKKYIDKLLQCGLIDSFIKPMKRGPPRRYFQISRSITLLLEISPKGIHVYQLSSPYIEKNVEILSKYPSIGELASRIEKVHQISDPITREKLKEQLRKQIEHELSLLESAIDFIHKLLKKLKEQ